MGENARKRVKTGVVISDRMDKTRVIKVTGTKKHPVYEKYLKSENKFYAHDAENKSKAGDLVAIEESIPMSKMKRWTITRILEKAK
jgi:small subunit ribosomal protein S17